MVGGSVIGTPEGRGDMADKWANWSAGPRDVMGLGFGSDRPSASSAVSFPEAGRPPTRSRGVKPRVQPTELLSRAAPEGILTP